MAITTVRLDGNTQRTTIKSRHHEYHADEPVSAGGTDTAPTPTEMVMGALGSCMAITAKMYADRKKWPLEGVEVSLDYERFSGRDYEAYEGDEMFVHEIRKHITFHGPLDDDQRERLLEISTRCPVHRLLATPTFWVDRVFEDEDIPAETQP